MPAHRARLVQNAAASAADAVFLDLEDAVPPAEKAAALEAAAAALTTHDWGRKTVAVRLNAIDSPSIQDEIARLGGIERLDAFIIPKAEAVADIGKISDWITEATGSRDEPAEMELLIETARGLINVEALAAVRSAGDGRCISASAISPPRSGRAARRSARRRRVTGMSAVPPTGTGKPRSICSPIR